MDGKRMKMIAELYGIVVKEYLKNSADYENIAKSNDSVYILQSGFTILTNVLSGVWKVILLV